MTQINSFSDEYRFLSNFWPCPIVVGGILYPSTEHAYQALKTLDLEDRIKISEMNYPGTAKKAGYKVVKRHNWEIIRVGIMRALLRLKFEDPILRQKLLDTGDATLIEGNTWHDTFWGVCDGVGENNLGKLLMEIRSEL